MLELDEVVMQVDAPDEILLLLVRHGHIEPADEVEVLDDQYHLLQHLRHE